MSGVIFHHPDPACYAPTRKATSASVPVVGPVAPFGSSSAGKLHRILPMFLPQAGCVRRCVYCAQEAQTATARSALSVAYRRFSTELEERFALFEKGEVKPVAVAFYGGTFTALPQEWRERFLALVSGYRVQGMITHVRCSTRPDAVSPELLGGMREQGLDMVELGVQSFFDAVLQRAGRGYTGDVAQQACSTVRDSGMELGIQLLPGLPDHTEEMFAEDVMRTCDIRPDVVRIYPCIVLPGTELAAWHANGSYSPWTLEQSVSAVSRALVLLWQRGVHVIRLGMAHDPTLASQVIAGPYHQSFGNMARSEALFLLIEKHLQGMQRASGTRSPLRTLMAPSRFRGEFWGYKGSLKARYQALGLPTQRVLWWDLPFFCLT